MLCYRDMTFCSFYVNCEKADGCHRPLTPEVIKAADRCGLEIAQFALVPDCHILKKEKNNEQ